MIEIDD